jgi:hypothetical protein
VLLKPTLPAPNMTMLCRSTRDFEAGGDCGGVELNPVVLKLSSAHVSVCVYVCVCVCMCVCMCSYGAMAGNEAVAACSWSRTSKVPQVILAFSLFVSVLTTGIQYL